MTDQDEIDRLFEREMPDRGDPAAVRSGEGARGRVLSRLCRADPGEGRDPALQHLDPGRSDGRIVGRYRKIHLPGHSEHLPQAPFQHLEKRYFDVGNEGFKVWRVHGRGGRHVHLQRPALARDLPRHGAAGGRDRRARLQHADREHPPPRAGASADVPSPAVVAGRRLPERGLGIGGGEMRRRGRVRA